METGSKARQPFLIADSSGLISLTKTLARELGPFQINVNAVAPGFVETRLTASKEQGNELGIPDQMRQMALMMISSGARLSGSRGANPPSSPIPVPSLRLFSSACRL